MDLSVIAYSKTDVSESKTCTLAEAKKLLDLHPSLWIDLDGEFDEKIIQELQDIFNIHPLTIEDCMDPNQRSKVEEYDDYVFIILKSVQLERGEITTQRYNIILGKNFVITMTNKRSDLLGEIRNRIRKMKPQILKNGSDHLCYIIIDAVVDSFFPLIEQTGEAIDHIEDEVIDNPVLGTLQMIHDHKRTLIIIKKVLWPQREVLTALMREPIKMKKATRFGLRDVYDHMTQIIEIIETQRDVLNGVMDLYQSAQSNSMNEVMKVLTIIATIFIPLTFIAGIYGMNFEIMPELSWQYGYYLTWTLMAVVAGIMVAFFKYKKWF